MVWVKPPKIASKVFRDVIWNRSGNVKTVYLTFDDGPAPGVTPWVLSLLDSYGIKATFFCLGINAASNPNLVQRIYDEGHRVGSHGYCHLNGWKTKNETYSHDIREAAKILNTKLFRPPYGKIKPSQIKSLKSDYEIVMWDVLSRDYDPKMTPEHCIKNVHENVRNGSIIVFH
ncbi:MAG: polysaccharide deacetylase family protein, partial [Bacteroidota bacterium]